MKKLLVLLLISYFVNITYSQTDTMFNSGFKLSLSSGITYNTDHNIFEKGKTLDATVSQFNLNLTYIDFGYFISRHHELGISFGKNFFTSPDNFVTVVQIENYDTSYLYSPGFKYINMTWFSIYYNFHFKNTFKVGINIGELNPIFLGDGFGNYLSLSVGKYYKITNNFFVDITLRFANRNKGFKYFKSNQLSFSLGLNLKI